VPPTHLQLLPWLWQGKHCSMATHQAGDDSASAILQTLAQLVNVLSACLCQCWVCAVVHCNCFLHFEDFFCTGLGQLFTLVPLQQANRQRCCDICKPQLLSHLLPDHSGTVKADIWEGAEVEVNCQAGESWHTSGGAPEALDHLPICPCSNEVTACTQLLSICLTRTGCR
jgi:hypothetical protein